MDRYYLGYNENKGHWELFASDEKIVTAESTGYDDVVGSYETKEEAQEALKYVKIACG